MKNSIRTLIALVVSTSCFGAGESRVLFKDAFDGTGDKPAGFTEACSISEYPPSLKSLAFRPVNGKPTEVHQGLFTLPKGTAECKDYELSFKFLFPRASKKEFTLNIVSGNPGEKRGPVSELITISEKTIAIRPDASGKIVFPTKGVPAPDILLMPDGVWHQAFVKVRGKSLELFIENDGCVRKFAEVQRRNAPLIGFNFAGSTAVDFDDLEVRRIDLASARDFRGEEGVRTRQAAEAMAGIPAGAWVAHTNGEALLMAIPDGTVLAAASFRIGTYPGAMTIKIGYADGSVKDIAVKTFASEYAKKVLRQDKVVEEKVVLPDAGMKFTEQQAKDPKSAWSLSYNTRPNLQYRYTPEGELRIVSNWESFRAASRKFIRFELRPDEKGAQIWIDGRYAGRFDHAVKLKTLTFVLPANGAVMGQEISSKPFSSRYLALDVSQIANPGLLTDATLSFPKGANTISGIPFLVTDGPGNADTGVCRENLGSFALECDGYLSRTPFEGMPESLLLSVPLAQYNRAWALCAVEDDPDKVSVITARLTKFLPGSAVGRGPAIADTAITLPRSGEPLPEGVQKVGEVKTGGKTLSLYLVEFKMDTGNLQEIIFQERPVWLDFELLGKRNDKDNFYFDRSRKPSDDISGVHVFAATLERSPVEMWIMPAVFGNIYQPGEKPAMTATLSSVEKSSCRLEWAVRDIHGKIIEQGSRNVSFARAGEETKIETPFAQKDLGWYGVDYRLTGKDGRELLQHTASFARIAADTRNAGYESPYFAWNFGGAHGTIGDIAVSGPLLLKAGIRSTHVKSETDGAPWKLTMSQLPRLAPKSKDPQKAEKELEVLIKKAISNYPHASMALIFHESGGGPFPLELLGGKTEVDDRQAADDRNRAEHVAMIAKAYRKYAPQIKLVVGNSGTATPGLLAQLFRAKVPREYIDYIGEETVGMTMPPELSVAKENWILRETARVFGYGEIPVSACYEWKCRRSRNLGLERLAEWNVRDILIAHAWNFPLISTVGLPDVSYSYYNSVWGDSAFTHNPQVYPKPGYPAVSTATLVLDCAKFKRQISTGSLTVYALEFKRGTEFIYAFWTARGELDATLTLEKAASVRLTELLGRSSELKSSGGTLTIRVGEGAVYLTSPVALKAVSSLGERSFPREQPPVEAKIIVANRMDQAGEWKIEGTVDARIDIPATHPAALYRPFRRPGVYDLRSVKDEQKGDCLELELIQTNDCPVLLQEYAFLRLTNAIAQPGTPHTIGLWVKGNSSWGKVFWEIEDAEGEKWLSAGSGGYGCDVYDWPELAGINFDGWHFLQFPITGKSPISVQSPGQDGYQWQHDGTGNRRIDYPIKVTGVAVSMPRKALNLLEMMPVRTLLRLKDISTY